MQFACRFTHINGRQRIDLLWEKKSQQKHFWHGFVITLTAQLSDWMVAFGNNGRRETQRPRTALLN
jgi:hypothetical protein